MKRDLKQIQNTLFDLLVIGGGIQGATICYKAAQRGLRVLLVEKRDFCGSSSANSLKILHGGLRYLQTLDFRRMRDSIRSRHEIMCFAPHLVAPLACIMPAYGHGLKGKEIMRLAMLLNDGISMDRNAGLAPGKHLPAGHSLSKKQCLAEIPGIPADKLHGASVWYDALATNTERLVLEYILQATEFGAHCINYLGVDTLNKNADGSITARVSDQLSDAGFTLKAKVVINSAGAAFEDLIPAAVKPSPPERWARGLNIVVRKKLFSEAAVALEEQTSSNGQKRMLFMVPWRDRYTMIGTHYVEQSPKSALFPVKQQDIMAMVNEINAIYPSAELCFDDVSFYHAGLLPMHANSASDDNEPPVLAKESSIIDHGKRDGFEHYFSIKGIKYTTAPQVADKVLKYTEPALRKKMKPPACSKTDQSKSQTPINNYLSGRYGNRGEQVKPYVDASPDWLDREQSLMAGEIQYFMHEEMAQHLSDVVFRRSALGTAQCPPMEVLQAITRIMADHLNWDEQRQSMELMQVLQRYAPLQAPSL